MKKSSYRIIAEAIASDKITDVRIPRETKKINLQELKVIVERELDNARGDKHKAPRDGDCSWDQADPENKKDWMQVLGIEEKQDKKIEYLPVKIEGKINEVPLKGSGLLAQQTFNKIFQQIRQKGSAEVVDVVSLVKDVVGTDKNKLRQVLDLLKRDLGTLQ